MNEPKAPGFLRVSSYLTLDHTPSAMGVQENYLLNIGTRYGALVREIDEHKKTTANDLAASKQQQVDWIDEQRLQIEALHEVYHTKLGLEAPAKFWSDKANDARKASRCFYGVFLALVAIGIAVSIYAASLLWETISDMSISITGIPFGLMALILVPVLGYAWLLKQVSRLFLTNRAIADDASYRHVMTMTYLGLVKDPNSGISKEERGLILNALFRPAPASTQDDGPPMGVFDLINGKKP